MTLRNAFADLATEASLASVDDKLPPKGRAGEGAATPVTLSNEDADILNDILQQLGVLNTARNVDGSLRVTLLGGTVATVTTVGTVTTVTTVTTVATLTNQTNIGGFVATPQIPALMNLVAAGNISRMEG